MKSNAEKLQEFVDESVVKVHDPIRTIKECEQFLGELDKPELRSDYRIILESIQRGSGCVVNVGNRWHLLVIRKENGCVDNKACASLTSTIEKMLRTGLLGTVVAWDNSGATNHAYVTEAGREAIK